MGNSISNLFVSDFEVFFNDCGQCVGAALPPYSYVSSGMILALLWTFASFPFIIIKRMAQRVNSPASLMRLATWGGYLEDYSEATSGLSRNKHWVD